MGAQVKQAIKAIIKHDHSDFLISEIGRLYNDDDFEGLAYVVHIALQQRSSIGISRQVLTDVACFFADE